MVQPGQILETEALVRIARRADLAWFRVDADRNVVEMSPALERLTGFEAGDILGRSCLRVHRCTECLKGCGVFDHGLVTDKELELYRADGSTVRVRKSGRVFVDDRGAISGALEIVEPLDESKIASGETGSSGTVAAEAGTGRPSAGVDSGTRHPLVSPGGSTDTRSSVPSEAARIHDALRRTRYNRTRAARLLGISRTTLWRKMKEHGL